MRSKVTCTHYKRVRHLIESYFELIEYVEGYKGSKEKKNHLKAAKPTKIPFPQELRVNLTSGDLLADPSLYWHIVGRVLYMTIIRLDISFIVQQLSQFVSCPNNPHFHAALQILKYLKGIFNQGLFYSFLSTPQLFGFLDAD